ncbi:tetratricopeptide repeat protein [Methyloversatilis sp. NSM2]|uniref:tetratricopeptide repeat protein n=1 Tax=Methyloversatilis sp. NSM2 TaxID=3134135 RepID=UPI0031158498
MASFRTAIALSPDEPLWRWRLGLALKDSARFDEAMDIFKRWAKDFPKDPDGWRQIGFIHASTNRNADAVKSLEHAISIDPSQIQVWQALVEVYYKLDRHEDARRAYGRLRELDRERAELAYLCCIVPLEITR